jgi:hypothetical protein
MGLHLLCEPSHIAVELDGRQHLGDPEAYRRGRRKDALLRRMAIGPSASSQKTSANV